MLKMCLIFYGGNPDLLLGYQNVLNKNKVDLSVFYLQSGNDNLMQIKFNQLYVCE